jgi:hypothetical protein
MDSEEYAARVAEHYARVWGTGGVRRDWDRGPRAELPEPYAVLEFPPHGARAMWTYATCCMSLPDDDKPVELHLFSPAAHEGHVELLTAVAHYHRTGSALDVGHTVNFGRPWLPGSSCDHGLVSLPYLDGPRLEVLRMDETETRCYWLVPVTAREVAFKKRDGMDALEAALERARFNYLDPARASVV